MVPCTKWLPSFQQFGFMYCTFVHNDIDHACRDIFWSRNFLLLQFGTEFCAPHHFPFGYFMQVLTCILKNDRQYYSKRKQGHNQIPL